MRRIAAISIALTIVFAANGFAQKPGEVKIEATLDSTSVLIGEDVKLFVAVTGKDLPENVSFDVPGLDDPGLALVSTKTNRALLSGSSSVVIINGKIVQQSKDGVEQVVTEYVIRPNRPGGFKLGPAKWVRGGETFTSQAVAFSVSTVPEAPTSLLPRGDIFLHAELSPKTVYVGGQICIKYHLYVKAGKELEQIAKTELPVMDGFQKNEFEPPTKYKISNRDINGEMYDEIYIGRIVVFPITAGVKTIAPMALAYAVKTRGRDHPFYGPQYRLSEGRAESEETTIEVLPLPVEGKPADFSGAVGRFDIRAEADRNQTRVGDSVTFIVTIEGVGNLKSAAAPSLNLSPDLQSYDPEKDERHNMIGDEINGRLTLKHIVVPRKEGSYTLGPATFSHFDPFDGRYHTASSAPLSLVVGAGASQAAPAAPVVRAPEEIAALGNDILYIKPDAESLDDYSRPYYASAWFLALQTLPIFSVAGAVMLRRRRDRLLGDVAFARNVRASGVANERLKSAEKSLKESPKDFYSLVDKSVVGFIADKTHCAEAGLTSDEIRARLASAGAPDALAKRVARIRERCDAARYAPVTASGDVMEKDLAEAKEIVAELHKMFAGKGRA